MLDELMSVNEFLVPTSFIPAPNSLTPQGEIGSNLANATRTASIGGGFTALRVDIILITDIPPT